MRADDQDKSNIPVTGPHPDEKSFLGGEFLTWLYFHLAQHAWASEIPLAPGRNVEVIFSPGARATLAHGTLGSDRLSFSKADLEDSAALFAAVHRGAVIEVLEMQMDIEGRVYTMVLRADGSLGSVKIPDMTTDDDGAAQTLELEDLITVRSLCLDEVEAVVDTLFERFVTRRVAKAWDSDDSRPMFDYVQKSLKARLARARLPAPEAE